MEILASENQTTWMLSNQVKMARGLKTERVPIIFINKYFTQFIPGKQEGYATTTKSLDWINAFAVLTAKSLRCLETFR